METWACTMPHVQFLCVCVESARVAKMFDDMFGFEHVINCYIPSREYLPQGYGQLGCSGFVVSDAQGNFVSRKTAAFLSYGEAAFRQLENLVNSLVPSTPVIHAPKTCVVVDHAPDGTKKEEDDYDETIPKLGIASMDDEHHRCDQALQLALEDPTIHNLKAVLTEVQNHFSHEEALLVLHGFGGNPTDPFSPLNSHTKDHKRILALLETGIQKASTIVSRCNDSGS